MTAPLVFNPAIGPELQTLAQSATAAAWSGDLAALAAAVSAVCREVRNHRGLPAVAEALAPALKAATQRPRALAFMLGALASHGVGANTFPGPGRAALEAAVRAEAWGSARVLKAAGYRLASPDLAIALTRPGLPLSKLTPFFAKDAQRFLLTLPDLATA